jgi:hypothetical protein
VFTEQLIAKPKHTRLRACTHAYTHTPVQNTNIVLKYLHIMSNAINSL